VEVVAQQPGFGRAVEDMEPESREWLIDSGDSGCITLYLYDGTTAIIWPCDTSGKWATEQAHRWQPM
jgi:hypothetical protein